MNEADSMRDRLPSIDLLMRQTESFEIPRLLRKRLIQEKLELWRESKRIPPAAELRPEIHQHLSSFLQCCLQPVINATGIVLHTNLGRAPLHAGMMQHLTRCTTSYSNLEMDLASGKRGARGMAAEKALAVLTQAEAATVVNNCAAALILILTGCRDGLRSEILVSRSELVQIGGGFRIPEILETAGVILKEVGTTNRTTCEDYRKAIHAQTAMILKVHQSNFFMEGFVTSPSIRELSSLAHEHALPMAVDLGSGALVETAVHFGIEAEPTPASIIQQGSDMVCFSGDKLMGGPQAGIIAGSTQWIKKLKTNPFFRALRADKMALGMLERTAMQHLEALHHPESHETPDLPGFNLLKTPIEKLRARAETIRQQSGLPEACIEIMETDAEIGGGTMPRTRLKSIALILRLPSCKPEQLAKRFRECTPPIVGYIHQKAFLLNLRSVFSKQDAMLVEAIRTVWKHTCNSDPGAA
ncbi:MAG: L-seryl-tRNA(Sec) selenium transferase [Verrucomicrobiota bacterium]|nr:L-seryl-tRNA(Sec) selenium transferase [Verrucomicrobiota bacterium]